MASSPKATDARTSRSTFSLIWVNRSSNVLRRLSARTNAPTTNETPTRMAMEMAMSRPIRARMLLRAIERDGVGAHVSSPMNFILSSTRSAVGSAISSTILPSLRKITRSA